MVDVQATARRWLNALRTGRPLQWAAIGLVVVAVAIVFALIYGDLPEYFRVGGQTMRHLLERYAYLPGFVLLYVEESGVPLPAPGDVFVMYVGTRVPHHLVAWIAAWLGLIVAVVLGATNLYLISRRFGRRLVHSSLCFVWGGIVLALVASIFIRQQLRNGRAAARVAPVEADPVEDGPEPRRERPVESPGS